MHIIVKMKTKVQKAIKEPMDIPAIAPFDNNCYINSYLVKGAGRGVLDVVVNSILTFDWVAVETDATTVALDWAANSSLEIKLVNGQNGEKKRKKKENHQVLLFVTGRNAQFGMWILAAVSADCTADDKVPIRVVASTREEVEVEAPPPPAVELLKHDDE
jgi:hypothetical protein